MSLTLEQTLKEWHVGERLQTFEENDITLENLYDLNEELIRELIPSIGKRLLFVKKWKEAKSIQEMDVVIGDENEANNEQAVVIPGNHRAIACDFTSLLQYESDTKMPDFDLKTLLECDPLGLSAIEYYTDHAILNDQNRNRVVNIIIKRVFNYHMKYRLTHDQYNILTAKIITLFPNECSGTYYVPAIPKRQSLIGKPILAKGKMVDKARNILYKCDVKMKQRKRSSTETDTDIDTASKHSKSIEELLKDDQTFLKTRRDPWNTVVERWSNTYELRQIHRNKIKTISEFIAEWPVLNDNRSNDLINIDFDKEFPNKGQSLMTNFHNFFEVLKRLRPIGDYKCLKLQAALNKLESLTEDVSVGVKWFLLPYFLPPRGRIQINKKHWKFSIQEVADSLHLFVQSPHEIQQAIAQKREQHSTNARPVQPYVLFQGKSLYEIDAAYVVIDDIQFQTKTPLEAIDLCFKVFQTTNAAYPPEGDYIWTVIQQGIFGIRLKTDTVYPYHCDLLKAVRENIDNL